MIQVKARHVRQDEVNDYFEVYNLGRESEFVSFPRSMEANENDAISKVFR